MRPREVINQVTTHQDASYFGILSDLLFDLLCLVRESSFFSDLLYLEDIGAVGMTFIAKRGEGSPYFV